MSSEIKVEENGAANINTKQQRPRRSATSQPVATRLKALIDERTEYGEQTYGEPLHTFNGRNAELDAMQESIDLNQFLMQMVMEREAELERPRRVEAAARIALLSIRHSNINHECVCNGVHADNNCCEGEVRFWESIDNLETALESPNV